ncbi:hypothetical protein Taro_056964, partial [Colocasia esculenta]|nr:hypothetical protein [Colocasia esculenta]
MTNQNHVHLLPISQWVVSQCKRKTGNHLAIAKAAAIYICGIILFPAKDGAISFPNLSIIDSVSEALVHYNLDRCYLQCGAARTVVPLLSHFPPIQAWKQNDDQDERDVRSAIVHWEGCATSLLQAEVVEDEDVTRKYLKALKRDEDTRTKDQIAKGTLNWSALNMMQCAVHPKEYSRVSTCTSAKEMWDKLELIYEGTSEVRESKVSML